MTMIPAHGPTTAVPETVYCGWCDEPGQGAGHELCQAALAVTRRSATTCGSETTELDGET